MRLVIEDMESGCRLKLHHSGVPHYDVDRAKVRNLPLPAYSGPLCTCAMCACVCGCDILLCSYACCSCTFCLYTMQVFFAVYLVAVCLVMSFLRPGASSLTTNLPPPPRMARSRTAGSGINLLV